jgi:hypothetical protein
MCNGAAQASIQKTLFDKMRKTVWAPCRLSALQDSLAGCSLNMKAIDALYELTRPFKLPGVLNFIPSRYNLQRWNRSFEAGAELRVGAAMSRCGNLTVLKINKFIDELLRVSTFLHKRGRSRTQIEDKDLPVPIHIAGTCDGAKLTDQSGMVLCCLKFVDNEMLSVLAQNRCNDTLGEMDESEVDKLPAYFHVQSTRNVVLTGWIEGDDSAENN